MNLFALESAMYYIMTDHDSYDTFSNINKEETWDLRWPQKHVRWVEDEFTPLYCHWNNIFIIENLFDYFISLSVIIHIVISSLDAQP